MTKKIGNAETVKVKFIKDFEGHVVGEVLEVSKSNLLHFQEWDAVELVK